MTSHSKKNRGGVFVELILALPIIIIIPFAVLELARFLEKVQIVNVLGQEMAAQAYRECADFNDLQLDGNRLGYVKNITRLTSQTNPCLVTVNNNFNGPNGIDAAVNGNFDIAISVYRYYRAASGAAAPRLYRIGVFGTPSVECDGAPGTGTGLCTGTPAIIKEPGASGTVYVNQNGIIARERFVVVEVRYTYTAIAPFVKLLRELGGTQHAYREVTIL